MRAFSWGLRAGLHGDNGAFKDRVTCIRPEPEPVQTAAADPSLLTRSTDGSATERLREPQAERRRSATSVRAGGA